MILIQISLFGMGGSKRKTKEGLHAKGLMYQVLRVELVTTLAAHLAARRRQEQQRVAELEEQVESDKA